MSKDERAMRTILAELDQADDGLLEEAGNLMPTTAVGVISGDFIKVSMAVYSVQNRKK